MTKSEGYVGSGRFSGSVLAASTEQRNRDVHADDDPKSRRSGRDVSAHCRTYCPDAATPPG
jgi:hypothetical protein